MKFPTLLKILIIPIVYTLCSCDGLPPEVVFDEPVTGLKINLSKKVGRSFQVLRESDTLLYELDYNKSTKTNYLIRSQKDTVFIGSVTKRNELFLLNRELDDGRFAIHALKFTDSTVTGLESEWLQSSILNLAVDSGNFSRLLVDTNGINTIHAELRDGKEVFRMVVENLEEEKLLLPNEPIENREIAALVDLNQKDAETYTHKSQLIKKVYPMPVVDIGTVELNTSQPITFKLIDQNGNVILNRQENNSLIQLDFSDLTSGTYFLEVVEKNSGKVERRKIVKQ